MQSLIKPLLRPLPLIALSTGTLYLAASLSTTTSRTAAMASAITNTNYRIESYTPRHTSWPYNPSDFTRQDSSPDTNFYSSARFVTHIDDAAIASLRQYYATVLPRKGRILDFCSSWISHYPDDVESSAKNGEVKITGMGMNKAELDGNPILNNGRILVDLNDSPDVATALRSSKAIGSSGGSEEDLLDASTCVVSIDYLTDPVSVLRGVREATKPGGTVHLTISNRCFPTKAMSRWLRVDEQERLQMVGDYLHFAGWKGIEIVELSNGKVEVESQEGGGPPQQQANGLQGLFGWMGMARRDPLWVVRARRED